MAKQSHVDKAIESLQEQIANHHRDIAALEAAIKALRQEKPAKRPRVIRAPSHVHLGEDEQAG